MTSVASAASAAPDSSLSALMARSSSQDGDQGQFAQALNDANSGSGQQQDDTNKSSDDDQSGQSGTDMGKYRLRSLGDPTAPKTTAAGNATGTGSAGTAAAAGTKTAVNAKDTKDLAAQAAQLADAASGEDATTTTTATVAAKPGATAGTATQAQATTDADDAAAVTDQSNLAQLLGMALGGKKPVATAQDGTTVKTDAASATKGDDTADATDGTQTTALPTDTLLQLTAAVATLPVATTAAAASTKAAASTDATATLAAAIMPQSGSDVAVQAVDADGTNGSTDSADSKTPSFGLVMPTADATDPTDVTSVRIQKAGDAAAAITLSLAKAGDDGTSTDPSAQTGTTDTVVVLDSRRYLGFGLGQNATSLLSSVTGDREWSSAMDPASALSNAASASSTGNVVNTLKLQLNPENLGSVTANMRLVGDQLSIHLTVHTAAAYRELDADSKPMMDALKAQGFNVDHVTVSLAPADSSSHTGDQNQSSNSNAQTTQQQFSRDGGDAARQQSQGQAQGQSQSGQGQSQSRSAAASQNDVEKRNETTAVDPAVSSRARPDSVYL